MKDQQKVKNSLIAIGLAVFVSCGPSSDEKGGGETGKDSTTIENVAAATKNITDPLCYHVKQVKSADAATELQKAAALFCTGKTNVTSEITRFQQNVLTQLETEAGKVQVPAATKYIALAVKLHYTCENDVFSLIFQPVVYAGNLTKPGAPHGTTVNFDVVESNKYYTIKDAALQPVDEAKAKETIGAYAENRMVQGACKEQPAPFVTASILTIQEMTMMLSSNAAKDLIFFHGLKDDKHVILIGTDTFAKPDGGNNFAGFYGNFSHMCPPSCNNWDLLLEN